MYYHSGPVEMPLNPVSQLERRMKLLRREMVSRVIVLRLLAAAWSAAGLILVVSGGW